MNTEDLYDFLMGQKPGDSQHTAYVFIASKDNGVVDLHYWIFSPFSSGTDTPIIVCPSCFSPYNLIAKLTLRKRERLIVRTVNEIAQSLNYHAHKESGTIPWADVPKFSLVPQDPRRSKRPQPRCACICGPRGPWHVVQRGRIHLCTPML
jgi:hypothetical protein